MMFLNPAVMSQSSFLQGSEVELHLQQSEVQQLQLAGMNCLRVVVVMAATCPRFGLLLDQTWPLDQQPAAAAAAGGGLRFHLGLGGCFRGGKSQQQQQQQQQEEDEVAEAQVTSDVSLLLVTVLAMRADESIQQHLSAPVNDSAAAADTRVVCAAGQSAAAAGRPEGAAGQEAAGGGASGSTGPDCRTSRTPPPPKSPAAAAAAAGDSVHRCSHVLGQLPLLILPSTAQAEIDNLLLAAADAGIPRSASHQLLLPLLQDWATVVLWSESLRPAADSSSSSSSRRQCESPADLAADLALSYAGRWPRLLLLPSTSLSC
jgi:hypothetical protein